MSDNIAHAISGAGGGIISMILTYPLITVSSRLQVQKDTKESDAYKGGWDAVVKIFNNEGISGLYSGLNSAIFGIAVTNGIYYYFYETTKKMFEKGNRPMSVVESIMAGTIAGSATVLVTNPIWVVNTRMTTRKVSLDEDESEKTKPKKLGTIATILKIINEDGFKSFWQGIIPALILVINPIIQYTVFEQIKSRIEKMKKLGNLDFFLLGAISKLVATGSTYPYIVIKSRMQLRQSSQESARYKSTWDGLQKIIANEGYGGLYKGITSKLLQSVLTAAFLFMYKEVLFKYTVAFLALRKRVI
ncbi:17741_t:CDS:2 [Funneliformis caledonium]|uniref:17741_t:CDS:1 n=1 Tax=Funneliformis caledonium TaxID=1117310 RepID=A0A9N9BXR7_9GLOM|nr:17741_t:CDS:2 [Funneliformis caledonium]